MTPFQLIACAIILLELLRELVVFIRNREARRSLLVRAVVWVAALAAIAEPTAVTTLANLLGIGRGTDVVLYFFVLAFLAASFFFYAKQVRLQRQVDVLNSRLARLDPKRGALSEPVGSATSGGTP